MRIVRGIVPIHFDICVGKLVDELGSYLLPFFFRVGGEGIIVVLRAGDDVDAGGDDDDDDGDDGRQEGEGGASFRATLDGHFSCRSGTMLCGVTANSGNIMWFRKHDFLHAVLETKMLGLLVSCRKINQYPRPKNHHGPYPEIHVRTYLL